MTGRKRRGILVLGMHRSGTSAVAGTLAMAGGSAPAEAMPATEDNPTGYWESQRIARFNNALLSSAGIQWKDAGCIGEGWFGEPERQADAARAAEWICSEFPDSGPVVCKDPRICRLLPVWRMAFEMLGGKWITVFVVRNPLAVAASLRRRMDNDEFRPAAVESLESGILLWLRHNLDAERHSRPMQRIALAYETVLQDWELGFAPVFSTGILPPPTPEATDRIGAFLNPSLNREGRSAIPPDSQTHICGLKAAEAVRAAIFERNVPQLEKIRSHLDHLMETGETQARSILERLDRLDFLE